MPDANPLSPLLPQEIGDRRLNGFGPNFANAEPHGDYREDPHEIPKVFHSIPHGLRRPEGRSGIA
jgi:hypothetical protein